MTAPAALPMDERWRLARARFGSVMLDAVLIAYAAWCMQLLVTRAGADTAYLARWPWLLAAAPVLALLWRALTPSLGQRGYRDRLVQHGDESVPAAADQRLLAAVVGALQVVLVLLPAVLIGTTWRGVLPSLLVAVGFVAARFLDAQGRSLGERIAGVRPTLRPVPQTKVPGPWHRRPNSWIVILLLLLTFSVAYLLTQVKLGELISGWERARPMLGQLTSPDWSITESVIDKVVETVFIALLASSLALPVAFAFSFLGARNVMQGSLLGGLVYFVARFLMNLTRSVEPIIWAIIFVLWVTSGPFSGMLALFVHSVAALAKLYSEAIESIDPGPVEALKATGASPLHVIRYGMVPQVIPPFLSFTVYRWDINVRMATILGFVGGGGIGDMLLPFTQLGAWPKVGTIIVFITIVVWLMDIISSKARERLV
ncbi:MAG: phosphonate ABC transporter, permease protein PhnE [Planctomycetota bacterium]|nr:phosphonate ABC transporter, permease protein PhnE [Planctomycetota bacterium]